MAEKEEDERYKTVYLGDGLYAKWDGYQIYLMANSHTSPTDTVALDQHTLRAFQAYVARLTELNNALVK
jgi:hypothetical protein